MLDAHIVLILKSDGDATPLGQWPLSVLPDRVSYLGLCSYGAASGVVFKSWVPDSVFSAGGGRGSVEAWYATALDIEEVLTGAADSHVHSTRLRLLLVATPLVWFLSGVSLMVLMQMRFLHGCLMLPRFGLMVVWSWIRSLVSAAGAGSFTHQSELCWSGRRWGHVDRVLTNDVAHSCRGFVSVPGPLQTVQRAEL